MSAKIYWFSGTGNSLAVARMLAESLPDAELIPISHAMRNSEDSADVIGLVFPVYAFGPPVIVLQFIRSLSFSPDSYVFSVCTCAQTSGDTHGFVRRALKKRGVDLGAAWIVKQPENYPPFGGAPAPNEQAEIQAKADEKAACIADVLASRPRGVFEQSGFFIRLAARLVYPTFCWFERHGADRPFRVDSNCNGCGICAKTCPVQNIEMNDGRPVWLGRCEQCFACFNWCPQNAVQYGRSVKVRRYHHPRATLSDLLNQGVESER